jgi:AbrB family looped-hinge helix DNA binding protein
MRSLRTRVSEGGRIVIPASFRKALGIHVGDEVTLSLEDGELRVSTRVQQMRRAREMFRPFIEGTPSMADELIAERKVEGERE